MTLGYRVTLTFDLLKMQWHVNNDNTLKCIHSHPKFGKAVHDTLGDLAADRGTDGGREEYFFSHLPIMFSD